MAHLESDSLESAKKWLRNQGYHHIEIKTVRRAGFRKNGLYEWHARLY